MPFSYTDEQEAFAETVTATLGRHASMAAVRRTIEEPARWREIWNALVALDLLGMTIPESIGGLGLSAVEMTAVLEAAGRFAAPVPLTTTIGAFTPLVLAAAADESAAADTLARVVAGASGTVALPTGGPRLTALPRLSGRRLSGSCRGIADASRAELVALPALRVEDERTVVVVAKSGDLGIEVLEAMDPGSPIGWLDLDAHLPDDALVLDGDLTGAWPVVWTAAAAELVGLAAELVERSVEHARERVQFGKPIGAFQAVKHQLVDAHVDVERARSLTMHAAALVSEASAVAPAASHRAKAAASEAASLAARTAVQVHGGLGITREHDVSLLYLRARQLSGLLGGAGEHWALAAHQSSQPAEPPHERATNGHGRLSEGDRGSAPR
jgi:alkylation response protein AidB-like acyl-CoA dehydrogenase